MDLAHAVQATGIKENSLGGSSFTSINMCHDTDIPGFFQWVLS
jgi:hypothetical protein